MNKFCAFLSNGINIEKRSRGYSVTPCCWYDEEIIIPDLTPQNIQTARNKFSHIDSWVPACNACKTLETHGGSSFRHSSFDVVVDDDDTVQHLDLMLHNVCQNACIICSSDFSSTWYKQTGGVKPFMFDKLQFENLKQFNLDNVRTIRFKGGEPFANDLHLDFLALIKNPEQCDIQYTVSAQTLPSQRTWDTISKFRLVKIEFSADGVGEQFEYIRYPQKWSNFVSNCKTIRQIAPVNTLFRFNYTVNPFNIAYFDRFQHWVDTEFADNRLGDPTEINLHECTGNLACDKTPPALIQTIKTNNLQLQGMISMDRYTEHDSMIAYMDFWDTQRNLNWRSVFPELVQYYE